MILTPPTLSHVPWSLPCLLWPQLLMSCTRASPMMRSHTQPRRSPSDNSSSSEEDENVKCKQGNFTSLCLMGKSSRNISDSDVSHDLSFESLSMRVSELENALCNQDKLLCKVFQADFSLAQSSVKCLISQSSSDLLKWHRRLGHLSFNMLC
jgi:hypothetical protein